jgi:hypothetical protein
MTTVKAVPEGLKTIECESGVGGKYSPICFIPERDPIQDALKTKTKTTYFKLMLLVSGSKMRVAIWVSGTSEHFHIHVRGTVHVIKQMGLDTKFWEATDAVKNLKICWDITKDAHSKVKKDHKKKKDYDPPHAAFIAAKTALDKAWMSTWEEAGTKAEVNGTQIFQLCANLLSDESCQPWDKIIKALSREKCTLRRKARCDSHFSTT